ncbi:SH3 domain protein [Talaromyces stipitatus ATCC 10500]|uniref:SH3 domain protein n=1 Tax=Talaromyces stipitatus (strain ATCC 10500 / CBS 375.48 / QM 6759 / NRRL 1006) TaxID=441959 RepID=B8M4F6_TALSN|nr:SH3 domain protein [Talaromyces stipitatus ATCC 10500]EED19151.1 SH3 domain protein [Talaromyces stipitatus ATCC 10500]
MATTSGTTPSAPKPGLGDLEKELVCSICTELLYQPLTLLDCLHTFCGSCLKEWFSWQAVRSRSSGSASRFTCPACRAAVRATRPNATVTTLLDMVLVANPERDRTAEEKEEIAKKYKPGDQVLVSESSDADTDGEDRRLLTDGESSRRRAASTSHSGDSRRQRSADNRDHHSAARNAARTGGTVANRNESTRQIEHQSSLRSLLSASDVEDNTQEEIVRLIMEEGLLDGIDLSGLDQSQEEELSDRLVQIFLSRHPDRSRPPRRSSDQTERIRPPEHRRARSQTLQNRSPNPTPTENSSRRPPVSRPHLLGVAPDSHHHRRRASDETRRRRTSPTLVAPASTSETALGPAVRSSSDMTSQRSRPSSSRPRTRESSTASVTRRSTEPEGRASDIWAGISTRNGSQQSIAARQAVGSSLTNSPSTMTPTGRTFSASTTSLPGVSASEAQSPTGNLQSSSRRNTATRSAPMRQTPTRVSSAHYAEPAISCERCGKTSIQYVLHKRCPKCNDGNYHVCLHCYRIDRGCLHYYGVGSVGEMNFNKAHHPALRSDVELPHVMISQRYRRPKEGSSRGTSDGKHMTNDNPSSRLQEGMFCDICQSVANGCFWQCDECNEGEWGYCRRCVNQGRCCNHSLLPIRRISSEAVTPSPIDAISIGPITTPVPTQKALAGSATYQVLSFSTECDICKYPIAPSSTRFHCLQCNEGDYDVCTNCYLKLVVSGKISKDNGHGGWRRCLKGHRMIVIGYEDHEKGQRRVIVRDLVGGYTLKDELANNMEPSSSSGSIASPELGTGDWSWKEGNTKRKKAGRARTSHINPLDSASSSPSTSPSATTTTQLDRRTTAATMIPPDGGFGLVLRANWSYFAEESCTDELSFPRGAEITEAENINDEWYWGYYAGRTGLFPGAYCTLIREVV